MPRGKKNAIEQHINANYANGAEVTISQIAEEIGCTVQNVYIYIRKNPSRFTKIRRGLYQVNTSVSSADVTSVQQNDVTNNRTLNTDI